MRFHFGNVIAVIIMSIFLRVYVRGQQQRETSLHQSLTPCAPSSDLTPS